VLEGLSREAGLTPESAFDVSYTFEYPHEDTLVRLMSAPMGLAELAGPAREPALRRDILEALAQYRLADGSYRLTNEFHYLVARA
jgi:hypothetical protein